MNDQNATRAAGSSAPVYSAEDLYVALRELVRLQSHYARLLNQYDGGKRRPFATPEDWIARLRETGALPLFSAVPLELRLRHALEVMNHHVHGISGYDWNADPDNVTRIVTEALQPNRAISEGNIVNNANPERPRKIRTDRP